MSIRNQRTLLLTIAVCALALMPLVAPGQTTVGYAGGGVIQAGDVWESFLPQGFVPSYSDATTYTTLGWRTFLRMGNFDRGWTTPGTHWPSAYPMTPYWFKNAMVFVYDSSSTFNPDKIGGVANPSYFAAARTTGSTQTWSNFAQLTYSDKLSGAVAQVGTTIKSGARNYTKEPYWIDARRQHSVYEAAWPTNVGIDVKMRAHGIQGPNWDNLNDYVIVEIELKNTGVVDMNLDGVAEQINHDIQALSFQVSGEAYMSVSSYAGGGRNVNDIVPAVIARQACWIDDPDENGEPWAFTFYRTAPTTGSFSSPPTAGNWDHGFNGGTTKNYTDIYTGWVMLDAKIGGLPTDASKSTCTLPTKLTIHGTHPIGVGAQRGWFVSGQTTRYGWTSGNPMQMYYATTAAFFTDCGKSFGTTNFDLYNLSPNAKLFSAGEFGKPLTFVPLPEASWTRPDGSMQATGVFDQVSTEDGKADATTNYPTGYGVFSKGASHTENFDGDSYSGIGPFSLKKDSVMTLVFATVAGYRLEGIQKAVRAARWVYNQDFVVPVLPQLPEMLVSNTLNKSTNIEWDAKAETDAEFAGYKIYRSAQYKKVNWLDEGMRVVDKYQEQMTVGTRPASVYKPVSPKFDAFAKTLSTTLKGTYQPDTWGTWDLVKVIPKADLASYKPAVTSGYTYKYEDKDVILGFTYWYYVAAYKEGTYTGPGGETTNRIETHSANRNGATGLWPGTFPFGYNNANFPTTTAGLKAIGARQIVYSALAPKGDVTTVGVRPNPYKRAALHDNRSQVYDHKLLFYNLPPQCKITILDVAGQVIDVINFASSDASKGSIFWDMFSKDGIEVASGVYVYVVESPSASKVGYFSILR
jgi:hypothetical protein